MGGPPTCIRMTHPVIPADDYEPPMPEPADDDWHGQTPGSAFWRGMAVALTTPGIILCASAAGFGALARDAGISLWNSLFMMGVFFALPAQVVMLDQIARGASLAAGALAVSLTGLRLLPMCVLLMPLLKGPDATRPRYLLAGHFVAVTAWMEGWRRLPRLPAHLRLNHFIGIGTGLLISTLIGTFAGYEIAASVAPIVAAVLLLLTPIYFLLSLAATAGTLAEKYAIVLGALIGPPLYVLVPGFDLLLAGLIGGTAAHYAAKLRGAP